MGGRGKKDWGFRVRVNHVFLFFVGGAEGEPDMCEPPHDIGPTPVIGLFP